MKLTAAEIIMRVGKVALFGLAFVGFVIYPNVLYADVFTKGLYVRFLILIALISFAWLFALRKIGLDKLRMTPLSWAVALFGASALASMFFSTSIFRSFWGEAQRMEGVLGILHYLALFFVVRALFSQKDWITYFKCIVITVPFLSLYALLQFYAAKTGNALPFIFNPAVRPGSLFGNPAFFSVFLIFAAGFSIILYRLQEKTRWQRIALFAAAVAVFTIVWLGVRGEFLGLAAGALAFWVLLTLQRKEKRRIVTFVSGLGALVLISVLLVIFKAPLGGFYPSLLTRLINLPNEPSFQTRLLSLESSLKAFTHSPKTILIGWGQEHFMTGYNLYYNAEHGTYEDAWFDRAHNKLADVLVMGGLVGLISYLALWGVAIWYAWRLFKIKETSTMAAGAIALLVAYFVQNLAFFDLPHSYVNFFLLLAFLDSRRNTGSYVSRDPSPSVGYGAAFLLTIVAAIALIFTIFIPLRQSERYLFYFKSHAGNEFFQNWDSIFKPKNFVHYTLVDDMWRRLQSQNALRDPGFLPITDLFVREMENLLGRDPTDAQMALRLGSVYTNQAIGLEASGQDARERFKKGEEYLRRALELSPHRQELYYVLAFNLQGQGKADEAVREMEKAVAMNPRTAKARYYLAINRALRGEIEEAVSGIEEVRAGGWFQGFRPSEALEIIRVYQAARRDDLLPGLYAEFLTKGYNRDKDVFVLLLRSLIRDRKADQLIYWAGEYERAYPEFSRAMEELRQLVKKGAWDALGAML